MTDGKDKRKKIVEKIRALLAMTTDRGASETEAMNAAAMASKLMEEHDLTYEDIESELSGERYGARARKFSDSIRLHESHRCASAIGDYWDCKTWFGHDANSKETHLVFFGSSDDTLLAHDMMSMIRSALEKSWKEFKTSHQRDYSISGHTLRADFMSGAVTTVIIRLMDLKEARTGRGDTSRALVVAKGALVQERFDIFAKNHGMTIEVQHSKESKRDVNAEAFFAGIRAGEAVKLQDEIAPE